MSHILSLCADEHTIVAPELPSRAATSCGDALDFVGAGPSMAVPVDGGGRGQRRPGPASAPLCLPGARSLVLVGRFDIFQRGVNKYTQQSIMLMHVR